MLASASSVLEQIRKCFSSPVRFKIPVRFLFIRARSSVPSHFSTIFLTASNEPIVALLMCATFPKSSTICLIPELAWLLADRFSGARSVSESGFPQMVMMKSLGFFHLDIRRAKLVLCPRHCYNDSTSEGPEQVI